MPIELGTICTIPRWLRLRRVRNSLRIDRAASREAMVKVASLWFISMKSGK